MPYQRALDWRAVSLHHGPNTMTIAASSRITGPLVRMPSPNPIDSNTMPRIHRRRSRSIAPCRLSITHVVSSTSNMIALENSAKYSMPIRMNAARRAVSASASRRRISRSNMTTVANDAASTPSRTDHTFVPITVHAILISQNSSGGLSEYVAPLRCGTMNSPCTRISQATPR